MNKNELEEVLEKHEKWLNGYEDGEKANLSGANMSLANLSRANLSGADLNFANLSDANLSGANLSGADLSFANLSDANLSGANLSGANLSGADLGSADLGSVNLRYADLRGADISGAKELISNINFLEAHFERTNKGYIVYKTFGAQYKNPDMWEIKKGSVITENVNFTRTQECGCGINVAPLEWVKNYCKGDIWKCLIRWEWLAGVCCPYNSDGKIRCEKIELLKIVT